MRGSGLMVFIFLPMLMVACSPRPKVVDKIGDFAGFSLRTGTEVAVAQDSLIARYQRGEPASVEELRALRNNVWVAAAKHFAPSNIVLRQWALDDLFSGNPAHAKPILEMAGLLSYDFVSAGDERLWSEGYSYWVYALEALEPWTRAFPNTAEAARLRKLIDAVDQCFAKTAYLRDGAWYPAPFGDLRDQPLEGMAAKLRWQSAPPPIPACAGTSCGGQAPGPASCAFVSVLPAEPVAGVADGFAYIVATDPVGVNTHIPADTSVVEVRGGLPVGFQFYEGYDKKYSSTGEERADMLLPARILSIPRLKLLERFKD